MIEPTNPATIIAPSVLTPSIRPVSETTPCSVPSGQAGVVCSLKLKSNNNDDNDVKCTNISVIPVEHVEPVVMKDDAVVPVASIMHDETSLVNEISTAETFRPSDRTSDVHEPRLREAAAPAAFTATVAQSVSLPPALAAVEGAADKLPTPEGGSDGMSSVDEALPEPRETFPRDSARVLTRAEARRKYGQFLRRKWDFETIPHDERTVTAASGRRRTVQVYKESDLQQAVRKRHGTPIYAFTRGYDDGQPGPSNARSDGAGPSAK